MLITGILIKDNTDRLTNRHIAYNYFNIINYTATVKGLAYVHQLQVYSVNLGLQMF